MTLKLTMIPFGEVHKVYPHIVEYIKKAQEWTVGRVCTDDISAALFSRNTQLWIVFDPADGFIHGYLSTEVRNYPTARQFVVLTCGGKDGSLDACVDMVFEIFEEYARKCECTGIEISGRPAWAKHVKKHGYDMPYRMFYKDLKAKDENDPQPA